MTQQGYVVFVAAAAAFVGLCVQFDLYAIAAAVAVFVLAPLR